MDMGNHKYAKKKYRTQKIISDSKSNPKILMNSGHQEGRAVSVPNVIPVVLQYSQLCERVEIIYEKRIRTTKLGRRP